MNNKEIILLLGPGRSSVYLFNYLKSRYVIRAAIVEEPVSKWQLLKRRAKKFGWWKVIGQVIFQLTIPKILKITSAQRYNQLKELYGLDDTPIDPAVLIKVRSVNDPGTALLIKKMDPSLVVINGTRILSKKLLSEIKSPVFNIHAGITPKYRGVHGAYWALVNNDRSNCGVTVHIVDPGIDTGSIISQHRILPEKQDNFYTYPVHQLGTALPFLSGAIENAFNGSLNTIESRSESRLWYHPTLFEYLYNLIGKGVR